MSTYANQQQPFSQSDNSLCDQGNENEVADSASTFSKLILDGVFYSSYRHARPNFDISTFVCAEKTVLQLRQQATTSEHPGIMLGRVQSGKTRAFIAALVLALDNGYDHVIVLTKNSRALSKQTRQRLSEELKDFRLDELLEVSGIMETPESYTEFELRSKHVFVAMKQSHNLRKTIDLFKNHFDFLSDKRVLVIDDEADSASVGFTGRTNDVDANAIPVLINQLRGITESVSFLQVTATPYSLYLQPSDIEVRNVVNFRPLRPAFTELVPVPDAYVGGADYFGKDSRVGSGKVQEHIYCEIEATELITLKKSDRTRLQLKDVLWAPAVAGLRKSLTDYFVGVAIRKIQRMSAGENEIKIRYSYLLHTESSIRSHNWQKRVIDKICEELKKDAKYERKFFTELIAESYQDISTSVRLYPEHAPSIERVEKEVVNLLNGHISVRVVNSENSIDSMLDDTGQLKLVCPANIFIGGQALDRGVTLVNLIGFFYGRQPQVAQQDTVLQHCRMYGYRRPDLAVTRFHTTSALHQNMIQMEDCDSALRAAIASNDDNAIQFLGRSSNGSFVPCNLNKILASPTELLKPGKRLLPSGFDVKQLVGKDVEKLMVGIEQFVQQHGGYRAKAPKLVTLREIRKVLWQITETLSFEDEADKDHWKVNIASLGYIANQHQDQNFDGDALVYLWADEGREASRIIGEGAHAQYSVTPDSGNIEGDVYREHVKNHPIVFLLKQKGAKDKKWSGIPFYWPVIRVQPNARTVIYTPDNIDSETVEPPIVNVSSSITSPSQDKSIDVNAIVEKSRGNEKDESSCNLVSISKKGGKKLNNSRTRLSGTTAYATGSLNSIAPSRGTQGPQGATSHEESGKQTKMYAGFDIRDVKYFTAMSYKRAESIARQWGRALPAFLDYEMPREEIMRLQAGLNPFDKSSLGYGFVPQAPGDNTEYKENLIEAARDAWLHSTELMAHKNSLVSASDSLKRNELLINTEALFFERFLENYESSDSSNFDHPIQERNAKKGAKKMYLDKYLGNI